jgi:hypothetical protein
MPGPHQEQVSASPGEFGKALSKLPAGSAGSACTGTSSTGTWDTIWEAKGQGEATDLRYLSGYYTLIFIIQLLGISY